MKIKQTEYCIMKWTLNNQTNSLQFRNEVSVRNKQREKNQQLGSDCCNLNPPFEDGYHQNHVDLWKKSCARSFFCTRILSIYFKCVRKMSFRCGLEICLYVLRIVCTDTQTHTLFFSSSLLLIYSQSFFLLFSFSHLNFILRTNDNRFHIFVYW